MKENTFKRMKIYAKMKVCFYNSLFPISLLPLPGVSLLNKTKNVKINYFIYYFLSL